MYRIQQKISAWRITIEQTKEEYLSCEYVIVYKATNNILYPYVYYKI
jgi:hypothetical protein